LTTAVKTPCLPRKVEMAHKYIIDILLMCICVNIPTFSPRPSMKR